MEAPVGWIFVFRPAVATHEERGHGGGCAVIWYIADDGVARTAMGAIGEGIAEAPVRRVAKITPASVAGACVGRDQGKLARLLPAAKDRKARAPLSFHIRDG